MDTQTAEKTLDTLMGAWDGEEIIVRRDQPTGATIIIAVHSTRLGPACGGTRMKTYPNLEDAHRQRGVCYEKLGQTELARQDFAIEPKRN